MLAVESAWRVFRAEHNRLRQLLVSIHETLQSDLWKRPGSRLSSLRQLLLSLQAFDAATHRPKGVVLLSTLRGRSPEADDLLDQLGLMREQCDRLLSQALACLDAVERGDERAAADCARLLAQHRSLMVEQLDREDGLLHSHTAQLLTSEEWSSVVSSISSVIESRKRGA